MKTYGVAFLEPFKRARDCSFPSLPESLALPEKGQTPLALDPLPPIVRHKASLISTGSVQSVCGSLKSLHSRGPKNVDNAGNKDQFLLICLQKDNWSFWAGA